MRKMNEPLVSVIIPNYNHARYLKQRLESVYNQTYQNFEVIILDDCSSDNSIEIINRYKDNSHTANIVINERNYGSPFKQWSKGFGFAKGELVWVAESDDWNDVNFLFEMVSNFVKYNNIAVAFSNYVICDEFGNYISKLKERKTRCYSGNLFNKRRMSRSCVIRNASGVVFNKDILTYISDKYLGFKNVGDYQFWCEACACGNVVKVSKNLTFWRLSGSSVTGKNLSKGITANEDWIVYSYLANKYKLSSWEKYLSYAYHIEYYNTVEYENEYIKEEILSKWNGKKNKHLLNKFLFRFIAMIERHVGLLL